MSATLTLVGTLSFLAICISSLGLFGMVVFATQHRMKEVSIRKVLGAGEWKLVYLLGKGFPGRLLKKGASAQTNNDHQRNWRTSRFSKVKPVDRKMFTQPVVDALDCRGFA